MKHMLTVVILLAFAGAAFAGGTAGGVGSLGVEISTEAAVKSTPSTRTKVPETKKVKKPIKKKVVKS